VRKTASKAGMMLATLMLVLLWALASALPAQAAPYWQNNYYNNHFYSSLTCNAYGPVFVATTPGAIGYRCHAGTQTGKWSMDIRWDGINIHTGGSVDGGGTAGGGGGGGGAGGW